MTSVALAYVYDLTLPSRWAAAVQILQTCDALARDGVPTTLHVRQVTGGDGACLAEYDLEPSPNLSLRSFHAGLRWRLSPRWAASRLFGAQHPGRTSFVMSRGDSAVELMRHVAPRARPRAPFIYEAHRLTFAHRMEAETGRRWDGSVPTSGAFRDLFEAERRAIESADGLVCLTEGVRDAVLSLFAPRAPVLILPSGTRVPEERPEHIAAGSRDLDVVYAGKLMTRKGLPLLLEAMRHLPGRTLHVLGGSPEEVEASRRAIEGDELTTRVHFLGFVEPRTVMSWLARARVGVCPLPSGISVTSDEFTSSLKVLELMAAGTPVVASDLPTIRSMVTHGVDGWLVSPDDPRQLADGVRAVLDDEGLAQKLVDGARVRVREFDWRFRANRLKTFLEQIAHTWTTRRGTTHD